MAHTRDEVAPTREGSGEAPQPPGKSAVWIALFAVAAATACVYWNAGNLGFVNIDDPQYVYENAEVERGLTLEGVHWAFTTFHASNWHPLTWLSHMADVQIFGVAPGPPHVVNVLLHLVASLLLFAFLHRASRQPWRSAAVAVLFAVHPLHVESVAWISERKDVLSAVFWMATCLAYVEYARRPNGPRYALVVLGCAAGLLAKSMGVTLPFVLLLLDYWPLGRLEGGPGLARRIGRVVLEKVPLFALAAASSAVTYLSQSRGGSVAQTSGVEGTLGFTGRLANALFSYVLYLEKAAWPSDLAALYPHPGLAATGFPAWKGVVSGAILALLTGVVLREARRRPYLPVGWFWYLGTLVPVIGLVQVGLQGMADRYTYLPLVGIFLAVTWLAADLASGSVRRRRVLGAVACLVLVALVAVAHRQVGYWRDSFTLFRHAVSVTDENWLAWRNLGGAYQDENLQGEAIPCFEESLRLWPYAGGTWNALAIGYSSVGRHEEALKAFRKAVQFQPEDAATWFNFAIECAGQGRWQEVAQIEPRLRALSPALWNRLSGILAREPR